MSSDDPLDYQKNRAYYLAREKSEAGKKKRVQRDQARTQAIKDGKLKGKNDPREIDHRKSLSKGGSNHPSNIGVLSPTANRRKHNSK